MARISLLTFNAGLLVVRLFGRVVAEPVPFVKERSRALASAIRKRDSHLVTLQEVFEPKKSQLASELATDYPYSAGFTRSACLGAGSGLLALSKTPISDIHYHRFPDVDIQERLFVEKGVLTFRLSLCDLIVDVAVVHTTAGGLIHTESAKANGWRKKNIEQAISILDARGLQDKLLLGDFNAGPEASKENYEQVLQAGFMDSIRIAGQECGPTWDPLNVLSLQGPHADCPPQRVDHIFLSAGLAQKLLPKGATLTFKEPSVPTDTGSVTLSDHYGLQVELESQV